MLRSYGQKLLIILKTLETLLDMADLSMFATTYLRRCSVLTKMPLIEICNKPEVQHAYGSGVHNP
jgi:hypothetical protein